MMKVFVVCFVIMGALAVQAENSEPTTTRGMIRGGQRNLVFATDHIRNRRTSETETPLLVDDDATFQRFLMESAAVDPSATSSTTTGVAPVSHEAVPEPLAK